MNKLLLIIKREYLTRVTRKSFILATLLTPLAFALFFVVITVIFSYQSDDVKNIVIKDEGNLLEKVIVDSKNIYFTFSNESLEELKDRYNNKEFDGILVLPVIENPDAKRVVVQYYSDTQLDPEGTLKLKTELEKRLRNFQIKRLGLDEATLAKIDMNVTIDPDQVNKKEHQDGEESKAFTSLTSIVAAGIGGVMGVIMYLMVFINGSMVMRSVMEEKTNRIVEVMISSVKPFQLMLGKIIGVGAVGLTQFAIWAILVPLIAILLSLVMGINTDQAMAMQQQTGGLQAGGQDLDGLDPIALMVELQRMNWWLIVSMFILFFVGGYFIYSSLFAAVGSAIGDDIGEGNSLTFPITIPVILAFYIMFVAIKSPNSSLAVWSSIFPLFSPIVMPARMAFNPPAWQIILSAVLLIGSALFFVWLSGRIYRVGILMYGKKATYKELFKWIMRS